jgi:hypothetical protein
LVSLIGLVRLYNGYGVAAFWVGLALIVLVGVRGERNMPVIPVYDATNEDAPEPGTRRLDLRLRALTEFRPYEL